MSMPSFEESSRTRRSQRRRRIVFELPVAEKMLPLVRRILADTVEQSTRYSHLSGQLQKLSRQKNVPWQKRCEAFELEDSANQASSRLAELKDELHELSVKLLEPAHGVVGFPTIVNGSLAYLVFRHEDDGIGFWRYRDQAKLRPIPKCWYDQNPFPEEESEGLLV